MASRKQFPAEMATPQTQPRCYTNVFFIITLCVIKRPLFFSFQILLTVVQTLVTNAAPSAWGEND